MLSAHTSLAAAATDIRLTDLGTGMEARVVSVAAPDAATPIDLRRRLAELGFLPGEAVLQGLTSKIYGADDRTNYLSTA